MKIIIKFGFTIVFCLALQHFTKASTVTAISSGDWSEGGIWDSGVAPGCYDTIIIPAGIVVDVDAHIDLTGCPATYIWVQGELHFVTGNKMDLACGSVVYMDPGPPSGSLTAGNGGGNSNWITICNDPYWTAGDGDLSGPAVLCQNCSLPIELISFSASPDNNIVYLDWETASETDNDYFTIERSSNGQDWIAITEVDGAGNSSASIEYHEQDRSPLWGVSYYRLKQTDFNGDFTYSDPVVVDLDGNMTGESLTVFPNPVTQGNDLTVFLPQESESPAKVVITAMDGKIIYEATYDLYNNTGIVITIDYEFVPGTYIINSNYRSAKLIIR